MPEESISAKLKENEADRKAELDELVNRCREVWVPNQSRDLEARHEMGLLLNSQLGSPEKPQRYGAGTVKEVAKRIGISVSEFSRVRKFASRFRTIAEFRNRQPACENWTQVKALLVDKKAARGGSIGNQKLINRLTRRVCEVAAALEGSTPEQLMNFELRKALERFTVAARSYLEAKA